MGERNLAGPGVHAAADQRRHRRRMMRRAKRAPVGQRAAGQMAGDRMDHRDFQQFARVQRRQDRRQALGEHRLAGARRAAHQQVVAASRRHFERALGAFLAADVAHVGQTGDCGAHRRLGTRQDLRPLEMVGELNQRARGEDVEVGGGPGRLGAAGGRADQAAPERIGADRRRQHAGHRADRAVERQFADHRIAGERVGRNRADRRHHAQRDRQVVVTALLRHVGGREIDGDPLGRQREARGDQRGAHPLARFGHRLVAESDDHERHIAAGDLHLNVDRARLHPLEGHRRYARDHARPPAWIRDPTRRQAGGAAEEHLQNITEMARENRKAVGPELRRSADLLEAHILPPGRHRFGWRSLLKARQIADHARREPGVALFGVAILPRRSPNWSPLGRLVPGSPLRQIPRRARLFCNF